MQGKALLAVTALAFGLVAVPLAAQEKEPEGATRLDRKLIGKRYRIRVSSAGVPTLGGFLEGYSCRTTYRVFDRDKLVGTGFLNDYVYVDGPGEYAIEVHGRRVTETFAVPDEMTQDRVQASWRRARAVELRPKNAGGRLVVPSIWALHPPHVVGEHDDDYTVAWRDGDRLVPGVAKGVAVVYPPEEIHDIDGGVLFENTLVHLWPGRYELAINGTSFDFEVADRETKLLRLGALVVHRVEKELVQVRDGATRAVAKPPVGKFFVVAPGVYADGDEKADVKPGAAVALRGVARPFGDKPRLGVKATDAGKDEGALVGGFVDGSPAAAAGVKVGDRIVAVDGAPVKGQEDLVKALASKKAGDEVALTIRRAGRSEALEVKVKLGG